MCSLVSSVNEQFSSIDVSVLRVAFISGGGAVTVNEKIPVGTHN